MTNATIVRNITFMEEELIVSIQVQPINLLMGMEGKVTIVNCDTIRKQCNNGEIDGL